MLGQRLWATREGDKGEYLAMYALSHFAQVVPVPRQEDFGVDFYGALLRRDGNVVRDGVRFEGQIKTGRRGERITFGRKRGGVWRHHEVKWLFEGTPLAHLFLRVDPRLDRVRIYSTTRMWGVRWAAGYPTQVQLIAARPRRQPETIRRRGSVGGKADQPPGDGHRWEVYLGRPILDLRASELASNPDRQLHAARVLERWCKLDAWNRRLAAHGVPFWLNPVEVKTNVDLDPGLVEPITFGNATPGQNIQAIEHALLPLIACYKQNLHLQGRSSRLAGMGALRDWALDPQRIRRFVEDALA